MLPKYLVTHIAIFIGLLLILDFVYKSLTLNALNFLPASRLLKLTGDPTVYYVSQNGLKMAIPSAEVFLSYGAKWQDIEIIEQPELDFYKDAEYIKLLDDARVFRLKAGVKRYLTQKAASALKIFPEEVIPVNKKEFNSYSTGTILDESEALTLRVEKDSLAVLDQQAQACVPNDSVGGEDGCKIFEAMNKKDPYVCAGITSAEWQAKCYASVIPEAPNYLSNCEKITDFNLKNQCVSQVALAKNNSELCQSIPEAAQKNFCQAQIGIASKNFNSCDSLPAGDEVTGKNFCFYTYALTNADSRACEKISSDSAYKQACGKFINQAATLLKSMKPKFLASHTEKILRFIFGQKAQAQFSGLGDIPVGGRFLPGLIDIYTPSIICGVQVAVAGPNPGVFTWLPISLYDYFPQNFYHVGLNMLGLAKLTPPCPPTLFMLGSSTNFAF